ncbi:MAG: hypothetical protein KBT34_10385 [Prevotella sp.]|nr:hypothetical protein [Candidatus Prevotella equi]
MANYFSGNMKVRMGGNNLYVWMTKKGEAVSTPKGIDIIKKVEKNFADITCYTIETLFRTYKIECMPGAKVVTDKGVKKIESLKPGDGVYVFGAFTPKRLTMVKKIKKEKLDYDNVYNLSLSGEYYIEGMIFNA